MDCLEDASTDEIPPPEKPKIEQKPAVKAAPKIKLTLTSAKGEPKSKKK
jgi:hypothetical protein